MYLEEKLERIFEMGSVTKKSGTYTHCMYVSFRFDLNQFPWST